MTSSDKIGGEGEVKWRERRKERGNSIAQKEEKRRNMKNAEINREIADKVMGFYIPLGSKSTLWWKFEKGRDIQAGFSIIPGKPDYFNPAERIDHAWMVVEKLMDSGEMIIGSLYFDVAFGGWCFRYRALGELLHPDAGLCGLWADTASMAICLAALEAVQEK